MRIVKALCGQEVELSIEYLLKVFLLIWDKTQLEIQHRVVLVIVIFVRFSNFSHIIVRR